eukprot:2719401-Lingulodinium_polyedra.AAC.1
MSRTGQVHGSLRVSHQPRPGGPAAARPKPHLPTCQGPAALLCGFPGRLVLCRMRQLWASHGVPHAPSLQP